MAQVVRELSRQVGRKIGFLNAPPALVNARPALILAGVFVVSFVVSFALMWRARDSAAVSAAPPPPLLPAMPARAPRAPPTLGAPSDARNRLASVRPPPVPMPAPTQGAEATPATDAAGPIPLAINVYNRLHRHRHEGYVANTSNEPVSVTLEVVGADGRGNSTLQFEVPAGGRQEFSTDSGLDMRSNDQIVVHSDHYRDITVQVP